MTTDAGVLDVCEEQCHYGTCRDRGQNGGPYGCGGCCACLGGCTIEWEDEHVIPPELTDAPTREAN